ncbi:MAG: hypothetical protein DWI55_06065 [Chloroflexi bacterium]|nr:MAG: hypothetical protein DWI55_06065 [Chloroflexota bacterium]
MFICTDPPARGAIALVRMSDIGADCNASRAAVFVMPPSHGRSQRQCGATCISPVGFFKKRKPFSA